MSHSPQVIWLVAELEHLLDLKIGTIEFQTRIDAANAGLDTLDSTCVELETSLKRIEENLAVVLQEKGPEI